MKKKEKYQILIRAAVVLLVMFSLYCFAYKRAELTNSGDVIGENREEDEKEQAKEKVRIVIDAGHGGSKLR